MAQNAISVSMRKLEKTLKALANRRRLAILKYLKKNEEATVGEISGAIKLSYKATSQHIIILAGVDIVEREQRSLEAHYSLSKNQSDVVRRVISTL